MYIKNIKLVNFRNYECATFDMSPTLNVVHGKNAVGKTNLLESVYFAGLGKSPRVTQDKDLIRMNTSYAYIEIEVAKKYRIHRLEFHLDAKGKKRIAIDGIPLLKMSELIGFVNIVYFSPDEMRLVKEAPQERRRFMDISLSQRKKTYLYALSKYNKILSQRNKLLKTTYDAKTLRSTLPVWDIQLAHEGAHIIVERREFVRSIEPIARAKHTMLSEGREKLSMMYESEIAGDSVEAVETELLERYTATTDKDIELRHTSIGPHRDDIRLMVNDIDIRKFGSQGQQRTTALALKLAEIDGFALESGETPILLLDDVLSELDLGRQRQLLKATEGIQTILTCTEYDSEHLGDNAHYIPLPKLK